MAKNSNSIEVPKLESFPEFVAAQSKLVSLQQRLQRLESEISDTRSAWQDAGSSFEESALELLNTGKVDLAVQTVPESIAALLREVAICKRAITLQQQQVEEVRRSLIPQIEKQIGRAVGDCVRALHEHLAQAAECNQRLRDAYRLLEMQQVAGAIPGGLTANWLDDPREGSGRLFELKQYARRAGFIDD